MNHFQALIITLFTALLLSACGGSSSNNNTDKQPAGLYTGATSPAIIDDSNSEEIGLASTEATITSISQGSASLFTSLFLPSGISITVEESGLNQTMIDIVDFVIENSFNVPAAISFEKSFSELNAELGYALFCSGSMSYSDNTDTSTGTVSGSITFTDFCIESTTLGNITLNGNVNFIKSTENLTLDYQGLSIDDGNSVQTLDQTYSCLASCLKVLDYIGLDDNTYRVSDITVNNDGSGVYSISATFYHPDHGVVSITGTGLTFGCSNGLPDGGVIEYESTNGTFGSITFTGTESCDYVGSTNTTAPPASYSGSWL